MMSNDTALPQDGTCETPTEFPGFGRFGCIPDCGQYTKTTTLTINLQTFLQASKSDAIAWDLSGVPLQNNPNFTYNIYSDTMGDFIFANDMDPNEKVMVEVPDGNLTLHLYQTAEMSAVLDFQQIYEQLGVLHTTLPPRTATTDFTYGDPREILSASTVIMDAINAYCWAGVGPPDPKCLATPAQDTLIRVLGSYGLAGTVTMSNGARGRDTLVDLAYCSAVPNRTAGLRDPANKAYLLAAAAPCPAARRALTPAPSPRLAAPPAPAAPRRAGARALGGGAVLADPGCFGDFKYVTGEVDCAGAMDGGCPLYWYQVCVMKIPPYMAYRVQCGNHSDCAGAFQAPLCATGGLCVPCGFCQVDEDDAVDGRCPQDACPGSGGWPRCVNGAALVAPLAPADGAGADASAGAGGAAGGGCAAQVGFAVWAYHEPGDAVEVQPAPAERARTLTPSNLLLGPVAVAQRRRRAAACLPRGGGLAGSSYFGDLACRGGEADGAAYGRDPVFLPSSSIYNGKLDPTDFYAPAEVLPPPPAAAAGVNVTGRAAPAGFFAHRYGRNGSRVREGEGDLFRLYFDGRMSADQVRGTGGGRPMDEGGEGHGWVGLAGGIS
jgi:hypothetical protein